MAPLKVYTFSPRWGLPTTGPFALKLLAWLNEAKIAYEQRFEDRPGKGPLGKSPWIEHDGRLLADSDAIIAYLAKLHDLPDPFAAPDEQQALRLALKLAFEERFHQILEWELFVHPAGAEEVRKIVREAVPPLVDRLVSAGMIRHFTRQLHARGIGRLAPQMITQEGERLLDMVEAALASGTRWISGREAPDIVDFAIWGQLAPMLVWPMQTPVAMAAKARAPVMRWHEAMIGRHFPRH
jgi:glutathione S-transferase